MRKRTSWKKKQCKEYSSIGSRSTYITIQETLIAEEAQKDVPCRF